MIKRVVMCYNYFKQMSSLKNKRIIILSIVFLILFIILSFLVKDDIFKMFFGAVSRTPSYQCSDNMDNDGDGKCDFSGCTIIKKKSKQILLSDPGCSSLNDNDEQDQIINPPPAETSDLNINGSVEYQTLIGLGASAAYYQNWLSSHPLKNTLIPILTRDLGLDILRIRNVFDIEVDFVKFAGYSRDFTNQANSLSGNSLKVLMSSWSPPAYLKSNNSTKNGGTLIKKDGLYDYAGFADWWLRSLRAYRANGVNIDYISIQNEPDYETDYDSNKLTATETELYAGYNKALKSVYDVINPLGVGLLGPETISLSRASTYIDSIPDKGILFGFAHHLYGDGPFDDPETMAVKMDSFGSKYNYKPIMQTEYARLAGGDGFPGSLNLAQHINNVFVREGAVMYLHWNLFWAPETDGSESEALVTIDNPWNTASPSYVITPKYYAFKHFSYFIKNGWRRILAETAVSGIKVSAFESPDNSERVVVLINPTSGDILDFSFNQDNNNYSSSQIYQTVSGANFKEHGSFAGKVNLPKQSITSVYFKY